MVGAIRVFQKQLSSLLICITKFRRFGAFPNISTNDGDTYLMKNMAMIVPKVWLYSVNGGAIAWSIKIWIFMLAKKLGFFSKSMSESCKLLNLYTLNQVSSKQ